MSAQIIQIRPSPPSAESFFALRSGNPRQDELDAAAYTLRDLRNCYRQLEINLKGARTEALRDLLQSQITGLKNAYEWASRYFEAINRVENEG